MQAPIEISTYDQVKVILEFGVYNISCKYHQIFQFSREFVVLRIKGCSDSKQKQVVYTLDDLKDLESKIILIRDSKSSIGNDQNLKNELSDNKDKATYDEKLSSKKVDDFLDVRMSIIQCIPYSAHCCRG